MTRLENPTGQSPQPYEHGGAHLAELLAHLDLVLKRQAVEVVARRGRRWVSAAQAEPLRASEIHDQIDYAVNVFDAANVASAGGRKSRKLHARIKELGDRISSRLAASELPSPLGVPGRMRLRELVARFELSPFAEFCIVLCLASELDSRYGRLFAFLQDDPARLRPGVELALTLATSYLPDRLGLRDTFAMNGTLRQCRLLRLEGAELEASHADAGKSLLDWNMRLEPRVTAFLLGSDTMDPTVARWAELLLPTSSRLPPCDPQAAAQLERTLSAAAPAVASGNADLAQRIKLVFLQGDSPTGAAELVADTCMREGQRVLLADGRRIGDAGVASPDVIATLLREAILQGAVLCLRETDLASNDESRKTESGTFHGIAEAVARHAESVARSAGAGRRTSAFIRPIYFVGEYIGRPGAAAPDAASEWIEIPFRPNEEGQRYEAWRQALEALVGDGCGVEREVDAAALAGKFRLSTAQIHAVVKSARASAENQPEKPVMVTNHDLLAAARAGDAPRFGALARRVESCRTIKDLVLPLDQLKQLDEMVQRVENHYRVFGELGYRDKLAYGRGVTALFTGPPGTGKTLAAEIVAAKLGMSMYKIDLSQVVSKYIGETEKNLRRVFESHAILFFDEADALFGKRSEVSDAHDRYANIEIGYLLQQMEQYEGVAILATNLRENLDDAFIRRLQHVIEFPFPDEAQRQAMWEVMFPPGVRLAEEVESKLLAREIKLAGGNLSNIALAATFHAAAAARAAGSDTPVVTLDHIYLAARREHEKVGRTWSDPRPPAARPAAGAKDDPINGENVRPQASADPARRS